MKASILKEALHKRPFRPFEVETKGCKIVHVEHPEMAFVAVDDLLIISSISHVHLIDVEDVASLRLPRRQPTTG